MQNKLLEDLIVCLDTSEMLLKLLLNPLVIAIERKMLMQSKLSTVLILIGALGICAKKLRYTDWSKKKIDIGLRLDVLM